MCYNVLSNDCVRSNFPGRIVEPISIPYRYRSLPIGGGGYVTGFVFHPADPEIMYCRTDVGGVYRFDRRRNRWIPLTDHVSHADLRENFPISVALDSTRPRRLYIASGLREPDSRGLLTVSEDAGVTFRRYELPFFVHGNLHGRGTGERLIVDPERPATLWMASQTQGLWRSQNEGATWAPVEAFPETGCTFAARIGRLLLVGTEGLACRTGDHRGPSLYLSADDGATFVPVPQPEYEHVPGSQLHGLVAQRCTYDDRYVYVTWSANGPHSQHVERGYTCDCGDCASGRITRYPRQSDGLGLHEDITPERGLWGFSAISAAHGMLLTATIHRRDGDAVYLSRDCGRTWKTILHRLDVGHMDFRLSYMQPRHNGGRNLIHWLTGAVIDPHRPEEAWFNTGTGVFRTDNLRADPVTWRDHCDGMEETVHIGVYAPPSGRVQVLDMVGDLGGFAFTDLDRHCENSFANDHGDRWITCLSCDWPDSDPARIVAAARGNWTGETKGGLIVTRDGAKTWRRLPTPQGLTEELDALLSKISGVNINAGWVAVSADGGTCVWAVAERIFLHSRNVIVSHDGGATFRCCRVLDRDGNPASGGMKPIADRCDARVFYGFGDRGQLYVSTDGGDTFREKQAPANFPAADFARVDCADKTEIRAASGQLGDVYTATGVGLWKLHYDRTSDRFTGRCLTEEGDRVGCVGLGLGRPGGDYASEPKALYIHGCLGGTFGFWRTLDEGRTWQRINSDRQMYGGIHSVDGDKRVFGRFYLATGGRGLIYGEETQNTAKEHK